MNIFVKLFTCFVSQDSVSDVLELMKKQEDLEAMIQAQSDRFNNLHNRKTQVQHRHNVQTFKTCYDSKFVLTRENH